MDKKRLISSLQASCAKREYCSGQIRQKIAKICSDGKYEGGKVLSADEISQILLLLQRDKFIDDERFACFYVRDKAKFNKWGRIKIALKLRQLGVGEGVIERAMAQNEQLFCGDGLVQLLQKKWDSLKAGESETVKKQKVLRFALSRGYRWGEIMAVLEKLG